MADTVSLLEIERAENFFRASEPGLAVPQLTATLRRDPSNHVASSRLVSALVHRHWVLGMPWGSSRKGRS